MHTHTHDESFEKIDYIEWVRHCVTLIESVHINLDACNDVCEKLVPLLTFHRKTCPHDTTHDGSFFLLLCFVSSRNNFSTCDFSLFTRTIYCLRILFIAHLICLHFSPFFHYKNGDRFIKLAHNKSSHFSILFANWLRLDSMMDHNKRTQHICLPYKSIL